MSIRQVDSLRRGGASLKGAANRAVGNAAAHMVPSQGFVSQKEYARKHAVNRVVPGRD